MLESNGASGSTHTKTHVEDSQVHHAAAFVKTDIEPLYSAVLSTWPGLQRRRHPTLRNSAVASSLWVSYPPLPTAPARGVADAPPPPLWFSVPLRRAITGVGAECLGTDRGAIGSAYQFTRPNSR